MLNTNSMNNDICLLRLDSAISENEVDNFPFSKNFRQSKACLPSFTAPVNESCIVAGWGLLNSGDTDKVIKLFCLFYSHLRGSVHFGRYGYPRLYGLLMKNFLLGLYIILNIPSK